MKIKGVKLGWYEALAGVAVALTLLTNYRSDMGVGPGEIGLVLAIMVGMFRAAGFGRFRYPDDAWRMPFLLIAYVVAILLPLTLIGLLAETIGTSLRDWVAYLLSFVFILSLRSGRADIALMGKAFLLALAIALLYQYMSGGLSAWYANRFTGGARNPNQLALYCACAGLISVVAFRWTLLRICSIAFFCVFGILARSDAYHAALAAVLVTGLICLLVPWRYSLSIGLPLILGTLALTVAYGGEIDQVAGVAWRGADEGGGRLILYMNGVEAWLSSPLSVVLGNGAGNYSGLTGPFQLSESHNTPVDLLSIGGVVGLLVFYWYPVKFAFQIYSDRRVALFAFYAGLLVFSLFHFVIRHPVWWFAIYAVAWTIARERQQLRAGKA
jgi:hypothetical protein